MKQRKEKTLFLSDGDSVMEMVVEETDKMFFLIRRVKQHYLHSRTASLWYYGSTVRKDSLRYYGDKLEDAYLAVFQKLEKIKEDRQYDLDNARLDLDSLRRTMQELGFEAPASLSYDTDIDSPKVS